MVAVNGLAMRGSFSPTTQYRVGVMRQRFQERVVRDAHQRVTPRPAMTPRSRTTEVFGTYQCQLCSINNYFSVISQQGARVNRLFRSGGLAIMDSYSQYVRGSPCEELPLVSVAAIIPKISACRSINNRSIHVLWRLRR
jgi:hypothetical protein